MLARFGAEVRASLGNGTLECAERDAGGEAAERAREAAELAAGLAARRDELAARLARFRQVRQMMASWLPVLGFCVLLGCKYTSMLCVEAKSRYVVGNRLPQCMLHKSWSLHSNRVKSSLFSCQ